MPITTFSNEDRNKILTLTNDLARDNFSAQIDNEKITKKDLENHLRDKINNDILEGKSLYQAQRRNREIMYEIIEEITDLTIGEDVLDSPFIKAFVEVKNRKLGDKTSFYSEGNLLSVATFAGNHWDTDRQALDLGQSFTTKAEWCYIHVYDELERFLLGITTLDKLTDKIYKAFNKFFGERMYLQFQNIANAVPSEFSATGNSEEAVGRLVDLVTTAGGYSNVTIAGTKSALRKLAGIIPDKFLADTQKEAKAQTGIIKEWEGNPLMVIPQALKSGTFEFALDDTKLFILGGDSKPIKFEYFGDTRTIPLDTTGRANNDMTIDMQIQTKFGMALSLPQYFGVFTLS